MTERRARLTARLSLAPLVLGAALAPGCAEDARWERARSVYCDELELLGREAEGRIAAVAQSVQGGQPLSCDQAEVALQVLAAQIHGFTKVAHVLARARPDDQSVEQAGFRLEFGVDALQRHSSSACRARDHGEAARQFVELKARVADQFNDGVALCEAVGWKSALREAPAAP